MKENKGEVVDLGALNFARIGHNYLMEKRGGSYSVDDLNLMTSFVSYALEPKNRQLKKYKVAIMLIAINPPYWTYMKQVVDGIRAFFLPGHEVEILCWTDMANFPEAKDVTYGTKIIPTESITWPYPTLLRFHLMLQQEEYLKDFDYIFFLDLDMRVVNVVGDEILGEGLTAAQHPMYALRKEFHPPYEPNKDSASFIKRPGKIMIENNKKRFIPLYYAGGFQGGKTKDFIEAMKVMKGLIDKDLENNYIPIWNDESTWNKYLADYKEPDTILTPSYVYPDSMVTNPDGSPGYYRRLWGCDYPQKIITLTKPFTTSKEGGEAARKMMETL